MQMSMSNSVQEEEHLSIPVKCSHQKGAQKSDHCLWVRRLALSAGQKVLKIDHKIIKRPIAHSIGDKIRDSHDKSQIMEDRRECMAASSNALTTLGVVSRGCSNVLPYSYFYHRY